jgi:hypothetical protein
MLLATSCPCCGQAPARSYPAAVSPFIAAYVFGRGPWPTALLECGGCGFRYFEGRFEADEEARLYAGYRGERYFRERRGFEWWYGRRANRALGWDAREIEARKRRIARVLERQPGVAGLPSVLDFGGDRGQFIPDSLGPERYVLDLSGADPVAGVTALAGLAQLGPGRTVALLLCCHVLEHSADPAALLAQAGKAVAPGGWLYVEVPLEPQDLRLVPRGAWYGRYVAALCRHPAWFRLVDFYSTLFRVKLGVVPPLGVLKAHEHINFFGLNSLERLVSAAGYAVRYSGVQSNDGASAASLCCLAQKA